MLKTPLCKHFIRYPEMFTYRISTVFPLQESIALFNIIVTEIRLHRNIQQNFFEKFPATFKNPTKPN